MEENNAIITDCSEIAKFNFETMQMRRKLRRKIKMKTIIKHCHFWLIRTSLGGTKINLFF